MVLASSLLLYAAKTDGMTVMTGKQAFTNTASLKPGLARKITAGDLPKPRETPSGNTPGGRGGVRPENAKPIAPAGFKVEMYVGAGLSNPRQIRTAPNGDYFVADSSDNSIKIFRGITAEGKPQESSVYATGLNQPFGINFYPNGANPQWVYVGNTGSIVRFPYKNGDLKATSAAQTMVSDLQPGGNHFTRDVVFSKDGRRMFVAVGSAGNVAEDDPELAGKEARRANILEYTPDGKYVGVYGAGIRNPVGLGVHPDTGEVWCSVNERDNLGDNLVPDYVTHVQEKGFYGWPWFYIGGNQDPRHPGKHPEMKDKAIVPDILVQPHSASLGLTFYTGSQFPAEYKGDVFAAEHGSWNRSQRSGHEVIRVPLDNGKASGTYQDFLTGFVTAEGQAWGRPVGVAVAQDGSMVVTDDGSNSIWRVSYAGTGK